MLYSTVLYSPVHCSSVLYVCSMLIQVFSFSLSIFHRSILNFLHHHFQLVIQSLLSEILLCICLTLLYLASGTLVNDRQLRQLTYPSMLVHTSGFVSLCPTGILNTSYCANCESLMYLLLLYFHVVCVISTYGFMTDVILDCFCVLFSVLCDYPKTSQVKFHQIRPRRFWNAVIEYVVLSLPRKLLIYYAFIKVQYVLTNCEIVRCVVICTIIGYSRG